MMSMIVCFKKIIRSIIGDKKYNWLALKISQFYLPDFDVRNIQIEITYRCNKLCRNCNRHCNLIKLPYFKDTDMRIEQIEKFISQIKRKNISLNRIQILGGEPFLHPRLNDFISALFYKLMVTGNVASIEIWTNGIIDPRDALKNCQLDSNINKAFKEGKIAVVASPRGKEKTFTYVLAAPVDLGFKWNICNWPHDCGVLLNIYGYWPGGACGPIALLYGMTEYAKYDFPVKFRKTWPNLKKDICKYCAAGCEELASKTSGRATQSYQKAISMWMKGEFVVPNKF